MTNTSHNPLVINVQQDLYAGTTGVPVNPGTGTVAPDGWWSLRADPTDPQALIMQATIIDNGTPGSSPSNSGPSCLSTYSSRINHAQAMELYRWLATQMAPKASQPDKNKSANVA